MNQIDWVWSFLLNLMVGYSQSLSSLSVAEFAEKSKGTMDKMANIHTGYKIDLGNC